MPFRKSARDVDRQLSPLVLLPALLLPSLVYLAALRFSICPIDRPCPWPLPRPTLPSGLPSAPLFDLPRRHIRSGHPTATLLSNTPFVLSFSNFISDFERDSLVQSLDDETASELSTRDQYPVYSAASQSNQVVVDVVRRVAENLGLPEANAERVQLVRLPNAYFERPDVDYLVGKALWEGEFMECQRVASALLYLSDVSGGQDVFLKRSVFTGNMSDIRVGNDPDMLFVQPDKDAMIAWYNVDPMTEQEDPLTLHGCMPVQGAKYVAKIHFRNCSREENDQRIRMLHQLMVGVPHPSISVEEADLNRVEEVEYDDFDQFVEDDYLPSYTPDVCPVDEDFVVDLKEFYDDFMPEYEDLCMWWEDPEYLKIANKGRVSDELGEEGEDLGYIDGTDDSLDGFDYEGEWGSDDDEDDDDDDEIYDDDYE